MALAQASTKGNVTEPIQAWEDAPFITAAIISTSSVDNFGNAPQFVLLDYFVAVTFSTMPPKSKGKAKKRKEPVSTKDVSHATPLGCTMDHQLKMRFSLCTAFCEG